MPQGFEDTPVACSCTSYCGEAKAHRAPSIDMATNNFSHTVHSLQTKATCSLCKSFYTEPVVSKCGHSYCQGCINEAWKESKTFVSCPICNRRFQRKGCTRPNAELGILASVARQLSPETPEVRRVCEKHKEIMKLFCQTERAPICVSCQESCDHQDHPTIPIEEAVQQYQKKCERHLQYLKRKREELVQLTAVTESRTQELEKKIKLERHKVEKEFAQRQTFLEADRQLFLSRLDKEEQEVRQKMGENMAKLAAQTRDTDLLVSEMERKSEQKGAHLLAGLEGILNRCKNVKMQAPELVHVEIKRNICNLPRQYLILRELAKARINLVDLMLDPDTAHPSIILTEDRKTVTRGRTNEDVPSNPKRFDTAPCVLGTEAFTTDLHFWHVQVDLTLSRWAIGVAQKSVKRKGPLSLIPEEGVWVLEMNEDSLWIHTSRKSHVELAPHGVLSCIGIFLDCVGGQVAFYNADTMSPIHSFVLTFEEPVFPFFFLGAKGVHFTMSP